MDAEMQSIWELVQLEIYGIRTFKECIRVMRDITEQVTNEEECVYLTEYIGHRRQRFARTLAELTDLAQQRLADVTSAPLDVAPEA